MRPAFASSLASALAVALVTLSPGPRLGGALGQGVAHAASPEEQARKHYDDGITQYNLTNYAKAIEEFRRAYELTRSPALLFNIAQAYRLGQDCGNAVTFYRNYVREAPGAPNRADAESLLKEAETCQASAQPQGPQQAAPTAVTEPAPTEPTASEPAVTSEPTPSPALEPTGPRDDAGSGNTLRLAGWVTGGVGVVTLGLGAVYGLKARGAASDLEGCTPATPCTSEKVSGLESDGARWEKLGIGGMAMGAVLVGAGVTMVLLGSRTPASSESVVSAGPLVGGGAVFWQGRF